MKVRALHVEPKSLPEVVLTTYSPDDIKSGKIYEVFSLAIYRNQIIFQIINESKNPIWLSSLLFEVIDPSIPSDWICNTFNEEPSMILGPHFIAKSVESYDEMVSRDLLQEKFFWERYEHEAIEEEKKNKISFVWKFLNGHIRPALFGEKINCSPELYEKLFGKDLFLEIIFLDFKNPHTRQSEIIEKIRSYMQRNYPVSE